MIATYFTKDTLPTTEYYDNTLIKEPNQQPRPKGTEYESVLNLLVRRNSR